MGTNIFRIGLLITAAQFIIGASCHKADDTSCPSNSTTYSFIATSLIYPQQEIYHIGDTIFFSSQVSSTLFDRFSNTTVNYSNAVSLTGDNGIHIIDTVLKQLVPARDSFLLIPSTGSFIEEPNGLRSGINTRYIESTNSYQFLGKFVCKKKGIYTFGIGDLLSPGLAGTTCTKAIYSMSLTNSDNHIPLYQYALGVTPDVEGMKRIYTFRVQ
jgi:hypothetical protein